jgi:hypothetical protein
MMSVQSSSWQSKGELETKKKRCSKISLTYLEINWYLWYLRDLISVAKSLGSALINWGAV